MAGFADLFSVKEEGEILNAKKAAFLAAKVMQGFVVEKIEDIIDKNKKVKHTKLSGERPCSGSASSTRGAGLFRRHCSEAWLPAPPALRFWKAPASGTSRLPSYLSRITPPHSACHTSHITPLDLTPSRTSH